MSHFDQVIAIVVGFEGGFSNDPSDPGNWTGRKPNAGVLRGTKYGISAAAYPELDIEALDPAAASAIYRRDFWDPISGDDLYGPLALLVFDTAVNNGVDRASCWLQQAAGAPSDGKIGPATLAAIAATVDREGGAWLCGEFLASRMMFMSHLPTWTCFGRGWARRLAHLPYDSMRIIDQP